LNYCRPTASSRSTSYFNNTTNCRAPPQLLEFTLNKLIAFKTPVYGPFFLSRVRHTDRAIELQLCVSTLFHYCHLCHLGTSSLDSLAHLWTGLLGSPSPAQEAMDTTRLVRIAAKQRPSNHWPEHKLANIMSKQDISAQNKQESQDIISLHKPAKLRTRLSGLAWTSESGQHRVRRVRIMIGWNTATGEDARISIGDSRYSPPRGSWHA